MDNNLYREEILEHYKSPLNCGKLKAFDKKSTQLNPFCGDEISLFVRYENNNVSDISFSGKGCALCIAASSMLTDFAKGKSKKELTKYSDQDMLDLLGIEVSETRKKCALLALFTLRDCLA